MIFGQFLVNPARVINLVCNAMNDNSSGVVFDAQCEFTFLPCVIYWNQIIQQNKDRQK